MYSNTRLKPTRSFFELLLTLLFSNSFTFILIVFLVSFCSTQAALVANQKSVLDSLFTATNGPMWTKSTGWNTNGDPCDSGWSGITCAQNNTVVRSIDLSNNNLRGTLPALGALVNLQLFRANGNTLAGSIPDLSALTSLTFFDVSGNQLNGTLPSISTLANIQFFYAGNNQLVGSIPALTGLTYLQYYDVKSNQLNGQIPSLSGATRLTYFVANNNQLSGSIPSLSDVSLLNFFDVSSNKLTGTLSGLPPSTASMFISGNNFCGDLGITCESTPIYCRDYVELARKCGNTTISGNFGPRDNNCSCIPKPTPTPTSASSSLVFQWFLPLGLLSFLHITFFNNQN